MRSKKRDQNIVRDYVDDLREVGDISREWGLTEHRVRQILKQEGVVLRSRSSVSQKKPLSPIHAHLGKLLYDHCFDHGIDPKSAADRLGISMAKLRRIEQGVVHVELLQLQNIASFVRLPLSEIFKDNHG